MSGVCSAEWKPNRVLGDGIQKMLRVQSAPVVRLLELESNEI